MSTQKRPYRMRRRAALEEQTRRRITESTVALHEELGPARTSISAIAKRAGVRRSTVYRHFPNEDALFDACSSYWLAANPPPDHRTWAAIEDPTERTKAAIRELYAFYRQTQAMYSSLFRDEPIVPAVQRRLDDFRRYLDSVADTLMTGRGLRGRTARQTRAAISHALAFTTWHSLTNQQGLNDEDALALLCTLIEQAAHSTSAR